MTDCIEWEGYKNYAGYGICVVRGHRERAHRMAWIRARGPIPQGLCVLHRCDNPSCINVDHLFLGTRTDNARDREAKGRGKPPIAEKNHATKLTREQVTAIRKSGLLQKKLAKIYGVRYQSIQAILHRRSWKHLP